MMTAAAGAAADRAEPAPTPGRAQGTGEARLLDAAGVLLGVGFGAWALWGAGGAAQGRPGPVVWLAVTVPLIVIGSRGLTRDLPRAVPAAVAVMIGLALVVALPGLAAASGPPLGYANANAHLAGLGCLAAVGVAVAGLTAARDRWLVAAGALGALVLVPTSVAAALSLALCGALLAVAHRRRAPRLVIAGGAFAVLLAAGTTTWIALGGDPAGLGERSQARGELWIAAADLAGESPGRGIGPGGFAELNPVSDDPDLRWAHHGYLQVAAELGMPGIVMTVAALVWGYVRLWVVAPIRPGPAAVGAAALTLIALHATVDYVWHFPVLLLTVAALVGWATASPSRRLVSRSVLPGLLL